MSYRAGESASLQYTRRSRRWRARRSAAVVLGGVSAVAALVSVAMWAVYGSGPPARSSVAAVLSGLLAWRVMPREDPSSWAKGADAERATAALLEGLSPRRWQVFHDLALPGTRANVDHLVVGPTGVWVLDTKTTASVVRLTRTGVLFGSDPVDPGPSLFEAEIVSDRLGVEVKVLVVVHGEGLRRRGAKRHGVRFVPAARVLRRLKRGPTVMGRGEVRRVGGLARDVFHPAGSSQRPGRRRVLLRRVDARARL